MSETLNICVVDDDQYYNKVVSRIVQQVADEKNFPVNISSYKDGYECIKSSKDLDLVFLDFYLSTDNDITQTGLDVLKKLKEKHPDAAVVFMSQEHDWEMFKSDLIAEGAIDFIKKDDDLPEKVKEILKKIAKNHSNI